MRRVVEMRFLTIIHPSEITKRKKCQRACGRWTQSALLENPQSVITPSLSDVKSRGALWGGRGKCHKTCSHCTGWGGGTRSQRLNIKTALLLMKFMFGACFCISFKFKMPDTEAERDPYTPPFIPTVLRSVLVECIF